MIASKVDNLRNGIPLVRAVEDREPRWRTLSVDLNECVPTRRCSQINLATDGSNPRVLDRFLTTQASAVRQVDSPKSDTNGERW